MALSETLDTSILDGLFVDDWQNLYRPLNMTNTNLGCCNNSESSCCNNNSMSTALLDEILQRQDIVEEKIDAIDGIEQIGDLTNLQTSISDVSTKLESVKVANDKEISSLKSTDASINSAISDLKSTDTSINSTIENLQSSIEDVSVNYNKLEADQEEISKFLQSIFQWENQDGTQK